MNSAGRTIPVHLLLPLLLAAAGLAGGCAPKSGVETALRKQLADSQAQNQKLRSDLEQAGAKISRDEAQIETLQELGGDLRLSKLFTVDRVELGHYTGGYQAEGQAGDAGIRVYLQPIDKQGSVLKAAGDVTIEVYDLAEPEGHNQISKCRISVNEIGQHWASGFLTSQYSFDCPWPTAPKHADLVVRVAYVDYLTGQPFNAEKTVKVKLAPPSQPASQASQATPK